jgi:hypothetical protein
LQSLRAARLSQGSHQITELSAHNLVEIVALEVDAVIGKTIFGEIVSADFVTAVAAFDLRAAFFVALGGLALALGFI